MLTVPATMLSTRAGLSISMLLLGGFAILGKPVREWTKHKWWLLGVAWVACYALSYFWSSDIAQWGQAVGVKLPLLLLPLAFALLPALDMHRLRIIVIGTAVFLLSGIAYSLSRFFADPQAAIEGYAVSHVLRTPLYNSHIHFSAAVAAGIVFLAAAWPLFKKGLERGLLAAVLLLFAAYLHLLASKTGLVMLYFFVLLLIIKTAAKGNTARAAGLFLLCGAALWAAITFIPTLNKRAGYVAYSWQQMMEGRRDGLYSDVGRAISWKAALNITAVHPLAGVGAGDMLHAMREEYGRTFPEVAPKNHLIPHNQFLCVSLAAGLPALLFFLAWLAAPLRQFRNHHRRFYFRAMWAVLLVPLIVEPFLEVQAGVAVYLYFLLSCHYLLRCLAAAPDDFYAPGSA